MAAALEHRKSDLVDRAAELARRKRGSGGPPAGEIEPLLRAYYRHVAPEEVLERSEIDLYGAVVSHYRLAQERPQGTARVRVITPTVATDGWSADGHSVVEVVTDDMPFLVDSITMELSRQEHEIHLVVHPQLEVVRDLAGQLHGVSPLDDGALETDTATLSSVPAFADNRRESWMHVEISRLADDGAAEQISAGVQRVLRDVRESVEDWQRMHDQVDAIVADLAADPPPLPADEVRQARELLEWLADDHFTFLGYREYALVKADDGGELLRAVPGTGFGVLRADPDMESAGARLPDPAAAHARDKTLLVLTKANSRSTVHRPAYLDYVGVKKFSPGPDGEVVGEQRFLGLFSSGAYTESLTRIPVLREKAAEVLRRVGFDGSSHAGKALLDTLENYPRDELFHTPVDQLAPMAEEVMYTRERRRLRVFVRRDTYGRYLSVLVYLPRDRYNTTVRERFSDILRQQLGGESVEFTVRLNESIMARVHFVVRPPRGGEIGEVDPDDLERRLAEASRSWREDFATAVTSEYGEEAASGLIRRYAASFPEAYKEDYSARQAAADLGRIERLSSAWRPGGGSGDTADPIDLAVSEQVDAGRGEARLKVYKLGAPISLSVVLPMLSSMGVEVVDERPYELEGLDQPSHLYEFGLRYGHPVPPEGRRLFDEALRAIWDGDFEVDGFNALVLAAGLTWRQVTVLRAYAKYMRQGGTPFSQETIEDCLVANVAITQALAGLFAARFDPDADDEKRATRVEELTGRITHGLDQVASLDHDRILRSYLTIIGATLRTNFYQLTAGARPGRHHAYLSLKLEPDRIPDLPQPRPKYEIFVYSPRVEGVHLRFGAIARGGLRWSDRRDDFRTEVLGLVKAQMVKNTVIVPVGAKGGFYAKNLPDASDRDAWLAEGIACYRTFICGLLDLTDNLVEGRTVPPERVVRHDVDDSYLVVAADKGTATFSDIANGVAHDYGFWLGDAFASGGSVGYDHKAMGITARGAWVSVQRHFREMGVDCQAEDFTAVGIGDMSGDVFGNGMLCSEHTRLVAAFDHRDIFLDPTPDAAASYVERQRLFALPRSSWQDYDTSLISVGGGVFSRSLKKVPVSSQVREALGLADDVEHLTPAELMRAVLLAPVDLLWNGGIGTYVKGSAETHADAGDKANDAIRVDGGELRARCVGEGGNLGLTQAGRIEYAEVGGRLNTDFIDNSAGVDTSDHEVNIKILLDRVVAEGDLTGKQRNALLASMTDEVADLVLYDNYEQNLALANEAADAVGLLHVHEEWMKRLEKRGVLHRDIEGLPSSRQVRARLDAGRGLTGPELSVLLAWTKIVLAQDLVTSDLPDDPYWESILHDYFPSTMREEHRAHIEAHPLRREIITTVIVGDLVNGAGITYWPRLAGETGASAAELTRANFVGRMIFGSRGFRDEVAGYDNRIAADVQTRMRLEMRTLVERASRWLVTNRRPPLDSRATVDSFRDTVQHVMADLPSLMTGRELTAFEERRAALRESGVPEDLAVRVAVLPPAYALLGLVEVAAALSVDAEEATRVHFALGERLGIPALLARIVSLPRQDRWQTMARATLRDDLYAVHVQLTRQVLEGTTTDESAASRVADWEESDADIVARAAETLEEICTDDEADLARMSVGLRIVRSLLA